MGGQRVGLICFDVGCPDYLRPLLRFIGDELAEVGGRACKGYTCHFGKTYALGWALARSPNFLRQDQMSNLTTRDFIIITVA